MTGYTILLISLLVNILLGWYVFKILKKFLFISENLADLYMTVRAFQVFVKTLYTMNSFNGEPLIEELILRIGEVNEEMETFRNIFEDVLDTELEEELNEAEEEASLEK